MRGVGALLLANSGDARAQLVALAGAAALAPAIALIAAFFTHPAALGAAIGGLAVSAVLLSILHRRTRALARIAARLSEKAGGETKVKASFERIAADLDIVLSKVELLNSRAARDPITHMPVRDEFLLGVNADIQADIGESLLGVVRIANYERLATFDAEGARRVLAALSGRLRDAVNPSRRIGHVDRDCFAIWFAGIERKRAAAELKALSYVLTQDICDALLTITPDVQVGFALYPLDADDGASLLSRAFVSLVRPQRTAEGRIAFFAPPSAQDARRAFALEQHLRQAVRRNELTLHYQPFVDTVSGSVCGAEALLRWKHPELGQIAPAQFIPIMERAGLVTEIGLWTLNTACRQLSAWRGGPLEGVSLAINLSAGQFHDPSLKPALQRMLAAHGLKPSQLELELTETVAMEEAERTLILFEELKDMGLGLSIDDFGSGYSSLSYLKKLPFNKLKIDREFVTAVHERADSRAICRALIELSAGLGISVLAEGVETYEEVETLREMGCSKFQGFYFSRPLPPAAFAETVCDPNWLGLLGSRVHRDRAQIRKRLL